MTTQKEQTWKENGQTMANPIEFARLLGLTDRSHNAPISPAEKRLRKVELAQFCKAFDLIDEIAEDIFWARFAALFLPEFIYSFIRLTGRDFDSTSDFRDWTHWVSCCVGRPYFALMVRADPTIPLELIENVNLRIAYECDPEVVQGDLHSLRTSATLSVLSWLLSLRTLLTTSFTLFSVPVPPPHPIVLGKLVNLVPALRTVTATAAAPRVQGDSRHQLSEQTVGEIKALVDWVEDMDRREKEREERGGEGEGVDGGQGQGEGVPAFTFKPRCEAWSTGAEEEHCVDGGQGKLMKCTRCYTVSYCGVAHQRIDYKWGHKKVCFAPAWIRKASEVYDYSTPPVVGDQQAVVVGEAEAEKK